ncbi:restriction endonuclease [Nocardia cyriacigeorgica]|uniref:restriction endonuclease n=1 Tax=Nocardia cyriacigeorgica TaxID=135487 RepID=UPI002458BF93|nr:restriction endonuclease [Nocardia cyriacigeorgica]
MDQYPSEFESSDRHVQAAANERIRPLPWASRLSSMPYLPGGGAKQVVVLRDLLQSAIAADGLLTASVVDGNGLERSLRDALKPLSSAGFVQPVDRSHSVVTDEALAWLGSGDDSQLLAILHRHVRYVGELLAVLEPEPRTVRELMEAAAEHYNLEWTTLDQTRRRITWLTCLGAVEYRTATQVMITDRGRDLLSSLILDGPNSVQESVPEHVELTDPPPAIAELLASLTETRLAMRNSALGYVPRGSGGTDVVEALKTLVNAASPSTTKADLLSFAERHFGVSESSFSAVLTTLTRSGLIEQTGLNVYEPTEAARAWLESADPLDLALLMHARYLFVLEIVPMLREYDRAPGLARAAVEYFGVRRVDLGGIRTRLQILKVAGLIVERANWRYQPTALGEAVAARYPLQVALEDAADSGENGASGEESSPGLVRKAHQLGRDLISAGTDSDNPIRLEQATAAAFRFLGFETRHIGGGGKTDVLATVDDRDRKPFRVIVDAKSARSGAVNEGAVSFDTLREHQAQHRADHVVLVGPGFDGSRVRARAEQNNVTLITTSELAAVLARHATTPIAAHHFLGFVTGKEEDRRELEARWSAVERRTNLLAEVITVLAEEARDVDEVTHGALTSDQIYLIAREGGTGPRPQPRDIESVLELLRHPLIESVRMVQSDRGRAVSYHLVDDPTLVQAKLATLARVVGGLSVAVESGE